MARYHLTQKFVRDLEPPERGTRTYWDTKDRGGVPNLFVRIGAPSKQHPEGLRAFGVEYKSPITKKPRRMVIGKWPTDTVTSARRKAREKLQEVGLQRDPLREIEKDRAAYQAEQAAKAAQAALPTMRKLWARYEEWHLPTKRPNSQSEDRSQWTRYIEPALGDLLVRDVTRKDVTRLHRAISKKYPVRANRVVALLSTLFNLARDQDSDDEPAWRSDNPAERFKERNTEEPKERFLEPEERSRLIEALNRYAIEDRPNTSPEVRRMVVDALRLAMLTGCRIGEALNAEWSQFGPTGWIKPASRTKQKRRHPVVLSGPTLQLLQDIRERSGESRWVFPSPRQNGPMVTYKKAWECIRGLANLPDLRVHDLRHDFASMALASGAAIPEISRLLGHSSTRTTERYSHVRDDALKRVTDRVAAQVQASEPDAPEGGELLPWPKRHA